MEENKALIKEKMIVGKRTGQEAKELKDQIKLYTDQLEEIRKEKAM